MGYLGLVSAVLPFGESYGLGYDVLVSQRPPQYAPYLRNYSTTLWTVSFTKFDGSTDPAADLLKKTWNVATGQE